MKSINLLSILLAVILISVTACTTRVEDTSNTDNPGSSEENQIPNEEIPSDTESDMTIDSEIIGITWLWERYDDSAELNNFSVDDPTLYTLLLNANGTYELKADCNLASGRYTLQGSSITFEAGPTTLAECEPESLYNTFLTDLGNVVTFVIDGNKLVLNLWADAGNMVFIPAE